MIDVMEKLPRSNDSGLWYNLCFATIAASAALFLTGRKNLGLFVGLWPPTFAAMGNRAELNENIINLVSGRPIERLGGGYVTPQVEMRFGMEAEGPVA